MTSTSYISLSLWTQGVPDATCAPICRINEVQKSEPLTAPPGAPATALIKTLSPDTDEGLR